MNLLIEMNYSKLHPEKQMIKGVLIHLWENLWKKSVLFVSKLINIQRQNRKQTQKLLDLI